MTLVVDASVALRWLVAFENSDKAERLIESGETLIAPDIVIPEITNAIWKYVVFGDITPSEAQAACARAATAFESLVPSSLLKDRALAIAIELKHAAYDCFYLALAEGREAPLVTADERLVRRCEDSRFAELVRLL